MNGIAWAITAGFLFGIFQAFYRKGNQDFDAYRVNFVLLVTGSLALGFGGLVSQDISLLGSAPASAFGWAAGAGLIHFFVGWTALTLSQQRIGASRTGIVIAATPLLGSLLAAVFLKERVPSATILGVVLVTAGVGLLSLRGGRLEAAPGVPWMAILTAASWGTSPLFITKAVEQLPAPLLAVTVGLSTATLAFAVLLILRRRGKPVGPMPREARRWTVVSGLVVATAIGSQWAAYEQASVTVAISLMQISTPVVVLLAPLVAKGEMERITVPLLAGLLLVMLGSTIVVVSG